MPLRPGNSHRLHVAACCRPQKNNIIYVTAFREKYDCKFPANCRERFLVAPASVWSIKIIFRVPNNHLVDQIITALVQENSCATARRFAAHSVYFRNKIVCDGGKYPDGLKDFFRDLDYLRHLCSLRVSYAG